MDPPRPRPRPRPSAAARIRLGPASLTADAAVALAAAAALILGTFVTTGGVDLGPNTWTEIVLCWLGAAAAVMLLARGAPGHAWGAGALICFGALAVLTAASVLWSVEPDDSWVEAGRTVSYLAVFGCGLVLARLAPERWAGLLGAIAVFASAICGYALLVKVFPGTLDAGDTYGRLRAPFDYFNATGLVAALGLPACLWAGARRDRARGLRALAVPAVAVLATVIVLSYSRGAALAAAGGIALWFAIVPLRLRGALVLVLGLAGGAALSAYALATHALTHDLVPLHERSSAGQGLGVLIVLVLAVLAAAGVAAAYGMDRVTLSAPARRRIGRVLIAGTALIPLAGVVALAASSRGLTGQVSHLVSTLTNTNSGAADTPSRLTELGNSRGHYWSMGLTVGEHALLKGVGALGYGTAARRYSSQPAADHAHSFAIQTFADFGLIGVAVMLALLVSWALAVRRTLGRAPTARSDGAAERAGTLTLLAVAVVFGVHSSIDWTWFIPGTALPALLCAGWLAGRGPLGAPLGRAPQPRRLRSSPGVAAATLAIAALALACTWEIWQPLRAANASAAAAAALQRGDARQAVADWQHAAAVDPVTIDPLLQLAAVYAGAGDRAAARSELTDAVRRQPENARSWLALGEFELQAHRPRRAIGPLRRAAALDLRSAEARQALARALAGAKRRR